VLGLTLCIVLACSLALRTIVIGSAILAAGLIVRALFRNRHHLR
jgi:hypothetical protein